MGKIKQGILGAVSGKVGSVVGSSWKGIATLRSLAASVANPKTAPQVAARTKFTAGVKFASAILAEVVKPLWDRFAQKQSGYNAFISRNYNAFDSSGVLDPTLLVTSQGKIASTPIVSAIADISGDNVIASWANDAGIGFKLATDVAYITVYDTLADKAYGYSNPIITRASLLVGIPIPDINFGSVYEVYLSFRREDGTMVSDSSYLTATVQP